MIVAIVLVVAAMVFVIAVAVLAAVVAALATAVVVAAITATIAVATVTVTTTLAAVATTAIATATATAAIAIAAAVTAVAFAVAFGIGSAERQVCQIAIGRKMPRCQHRAQGKCRPGRGSYQTLLPAQSGHADLLCCNSQGIRPHPLKRLVIKEC
ncbi:MAG TPA: hypothetical protein VGQ35_18805 [Dongiaceae bacterium]|nr:hypothetical protein [Dongiaceae bacterium]